MLDRTIPFFNTILRCDQFTAAEIFLPDGYTFEQYQDGYEDAWALLEYEIGDFESFDEAKQYFIENYLSDRQRLIERGVFLTDRDNNVVGFCIAWSDPKDEKQIASLHWLVVSPEHQGKGLGRAVCQRTMQIFSENHELPVYIHTQPWSWKAILLYISLGFYLQKSDSFSHYENQYDLAMGALRKAVSGEQYQFIVDHTRE